MLKRDITYTSFDDEQVTETFYFNLTEAELIEYEVGYSGGLVKALQAIIDSKNTEALVREFKKLILISYGVKSDDGKRFIKSEELQNEFTQTAAYSKLFMELATDTDKAVAFIMGIIPSNLRGVIPDDKPKIMPLAPPPPPKVG